MATHIIKPYHHHLVAPSYFRPTKVNILAKSSRSHTLKWHAVVVT